MNWNLQYAAWVAETPAGNYTVELHDLDNMYYVIPPGKTISSSTPWEEWPYRFRTENEAKGFVWEDATQRMKLSAGDVSIVSREDYEANTGTEVKWEAITEPGPVKCWTLDTPNGKYKIKERTVNEIGYSGSYKLGYELWLDRHHLSRHLSLGGAIDAAWDHLFRDLKQFTKPTLLVYKDGSFAVKGNLK